MALLVLQFKSVYPVRGSTYLDLTLSAAVYPEIVIKLKVRDVVYVMEA